MPGRRLATSCSDGLVVVSSTRSKDSGGGCEDQYYMDRMREILTGFPNTGPPTYPVQILDHLYMGNQRNADNVELLRRYGITHVLNCAGLRRFDFARSPYPKESGIRGFLMISAEDSEDFDMARHFDEAMAFIDRAKKSKGKALVHCNLGVNRSGAIVAAYLMAEQKRTLLEVINYLKVKRFVVLSNKGFRRQLIQFARTRGLLDPIIRFSSETVQDHCHNHTTDQYSQNDRGGGSGGNGGVSSFRRGENGRPDGTDGGAKGLGGSRGTGYSGEGRIGKVVDSGSIGELGIDGRAGRGGTDIQQRAKVRQTQTGMKQETPQSASSDSVNDTLCPSQPIQSYSSKLQDGPGIGDSSAGDAKKGLVSSSSAAAAEEVGIRHRLWTLPRYVGRGAGNGRSPPQAVEVIVSEHNETRTTVTNTKTDLEAAAASPDRTDAKSRAKTPLRQLEPVYETKSCNDAGTGGSTASSNSSSRLTAAESMSAKISGFLNLLQPKKPFRSTSYSNVSSSQSPSSSFYSLSPTASATDDRPSVSSGSIQSSSSSSTGPGSSLSTARPLRIYTRSSTDSEIYRARQGALTAGQLGLPRPASKP